MENEKWKMENEKTLARFASVRTESTVPQALNSLLILFLILFSLVVSHSVAAAHVSLGLSLIAWVLRDLLLGRVHFARTSIDLPLAFFCLMTIVSSIFSVEPGTSIPKLKTLLLFGVIYIIATNLNRAGVNLLIFLLLISSLVGVGFSLAEKAWGRGMVIREIDRDSPLAGTRLQPGDVIWMIGRRRIYSTEQAAYLIRQYPDGAKINVEALHKGDPIPVELTATPELKSLPNPLSIRAEGRSREFRVSGFSRQFLTYAEQMQILALTAFGALLTFLRLHRFQHFRVWTAVTALIFILFSIALVMTASRAVIASFIIALLFASISLGGIRGIAIGLIAAITLTGAGIYTIRTARQQVDIDFRDDSASRRIAYMQSGLRIIPKYPLLGVGMDSHKSHWREWQFPGDYITHTHSTPIQIAMERGLITLGCYIWLMVSMIVAAMVGRRRARKRGDVLGESLGLGTMAAIIGFSISSLANYNFGDSEVIMLLFTLVGLVAVNLKFYDNLNAEAAKTAKV